MCKSPATPQQTLTGVLQCHHHGLLDEVSLDEAAEVVPVDGEVGQLEGAEGRVQEWLAAASAACAGHVRAGQGHDGGTGMGDPSGEPLLCGWESIHAEDRSHINQSNQRSQKVHANNINVFILF